jgi:hypothetical protein
MFDVIILCIVEPDTHILTCLEVSQATQILKLLDLALPAPQMAPLFRALNRQHTLQQLLVGGNWFGDDGVKVGAHKECSHRECYDNIRYLFIA